MATSVHSIASECAPSSRKPPRTVLKPEDVEAVIEETMDRKITVDVGLLELVKELMTDPTNVAICTEAVKIANALPTLGQAESQEEIERAEPHQIFKRFVNTLFIEAVFGDVIEMTREEIIYRLQGFLDAMLVKDFKAAMFLAFQASGRHIDRQGRMKRKRPKRRPKKCSQVCAPMLVRPCCLDLSKVGAPISVSDHYRSSSTKPPMHEPLYVACEVALRVRGQSCPP